MNSAALVEGGVKKPHRQPRLGHLMQWLIKYLILLFNNARYKSDFIGALYVQRISSKKYALTINCSEVTA